MGKIFQKHLIAIRFFKLSIFLVLISSCTATRFLNEGETFYAGAQVKINASENVSDRNRIKKDLESLIATKPNSVFLGNRPAVWFYSIAGKTDKKKGFKYFLKNKMGNRPVLLEDATPDQTENILESRLNNEGYFGSVVNSEVITKKKESTVRYNVMLEDPFRVRNVTYDLFDSTLISPAELEEESLIKSGQRYSVDRMQAEQQRVEGVAKDKGFFYFDDRYLIFEADTTVGARQVDLSLIFERGAPARASRVYRVKRITVFPNYSLGNDSLQSTADTVQLKGFNYIDNHRYFKPKVIVDAITIRPDSIYSRERHQNSVNRLMSLRSFKFVNARFDSPNDSSSELYAYFQLTPFLKKSVRVQFQAVSKSNNFVGPGLEGTFTNRNFFKGAELFQFKLNAAYEWQINRQQAQSLNAIEFGAEASLSVPRFITPFPIRFESSKYLPETRFKAGLNFQQRINYFRLTALNFGYGFVWRETSTKTHELFPAELSFVKSSNRSEEFNDLLSLNPSLTNSFQDQFIPGLRYSFTINTQLEDTNEARYKTKWAERSDYYFNITLGLSGNIINSVQSMTDKEGSKPYQILGSSYSQFTKGEIDFRYYLKLNKNQKLASRINVGVGYAYGNSTELPYIKQFAVGGSNSLRAFPARSVGPGYYNIRTDTSFQADIFFIDQRADIKLEANVEYRFNVYKALKGALFVDAGNIWLVREDVNRPGGQFRSSTFLSELAIGTGTGLRYDFGFMILRFDLAFPLRKPFLAPSDRWVVDNIDFGDSTWRSDNLVFNIAIGYPF